jgi:fucose permease
MERYRYYLSFLVVMLSIGVNVGQNLMDQFNIERNYLIIALVALTVSGLIAHRNLFFIVLVAGLTAAINIPTEVLADNGISPDILFTTLLAVIIAPTGIKLLGWQTSI